MNAPGPAIRAEVTVPGSPRVAADAPIRVTGAPANVGMPLVQELPALGAPVRVAAWDPAAPMPGGPPYPAASSTMRRSTRAVADRR